MLLPTKHLPPDRCILTVGAAVLESLQEAATVSELWTRFRRTHDRAGEITFDWSLLSLAAMYAIGKINYAGALLVRNETVP